LNERVLSILESHKPEALSEDVVSALEKIIEKRGNS
jgi:hypothetical protein